MPYFPNYRLGTGEVCDSTLMVNVRQVVFRRPDVQIYPNPANSQVAIVVDQSLLNGSITLVNAIGQTVLSQSIQEVKTVTLDISAIGPGWYQVLIENEGQILAREKLLIVHD